MLNNIWRCHINFLDTDMQISGAQDVWLDSRLEAEKSSKRLSTWKFRISSQNEV